MSRPLPQWLRNKEAGGSLFRSHCSGFSEHFQHHCLTLVKLSVEKKQNPVTLHRFEACTFQRIICARPPTETSSLSLGSRLDALQTARALTDEMWPCSRHTTFWVTLDFSSEFTNHWVKEGDFELMHKKGRKAVNFIVQVLAQKETRVWNFQEKCDGPL